MVVEFKTDAPVAVEQYVDLLIRSGLGQRRPIDDRACIEGMVRNASLLVTAWDGDHLIGAARSLTDFRYACRIWPWIAPINAAESAADYWS